MIGVSVRAISNYEDGSRPISKPVDILMKLVEKAWKSKETPNKNTNRKEYNTKNFTEKHNGTGPRVTRTLMGHTFIFAVDTYKKNKKVTTLITVI